MASGFGQALDECLESIRRGARDLDVLLARHPRHAERLRPILETALRLGGDPPRAQDKARGKARLYSALHEQRSNREPLRIGKVPFTWATRGGLVIAAGFMALVAAVGGTAAASSSVRGAIVPPSVQDWFGGHDHTTQMRGLISEVDDGWFTIRNQQGSRSVRVSTETRILDRGTPAPDTELVPGLEVRVSGEREDDETLSAAEVDIQPPAPTATPPPTATAVPPTATSERGDRVHLSGEIASVGSGTLVVAARGRTWRIQLDSSTTVDGHLTEGARVQVDGWQLEDGVVLAENVQVQGPASNKPAFSEAPPTSTAMDSGAPGGNDD